MSCRSALSNFGNFKESLLSSCALRYACCRYIQLYVRNRYLDVKAMLSNNTQRDKESDCLRSQQLCFLLVHKINRGKFPVGDISNIFFSEILLPKILKTKFNEISRKQASSTTGIRQDNHKGKVLLQT